MKNAGITIGMVAIGLGLASIGFNLNGNQAAATPSAYHAGPEEPTIVWYGMVHNPRFATYHSSNCTPYCVQSFEYSVLARAWSDGTVEAKKLCPASDCNTGISSGGWIVIASPNEGLNAQADINFDEIVDGADMGLLLGNWGKAPRSPIPASDCPLGLMQ
ncbi:MAG: hypothetical protein MK085_07330 [Phycisphaerales bacterium]|nr:hypothetical protein [Phycisphaerales bacterium]